MQIEEYKKRRRKLAEAVGHGIIVLCSNQMLARNYKGNPLPFRQDSNFLYYTGINIPDMILLLDCDTGQEWLAGYDPTIEDAIWSGPQLSLKRNAETAGIIDTLSLEQCTEVIQSAKGKSRTIHYPPPYTSERVILLSKYIGSVTEEIESNPSGSLIKAIIEQRSYKNEDEIAEMETAINTVTGPMHILAMRMAQAGVYEHEIVAEMFKVAKYKDLEFAYQIICSVRGETLHNESHSNKLSYDQLLLVDAGIESRNHYATDITRTTPVDGKFSSQQKEIYEIVLQSQLEAIKHIKPGIRYYDVHMKAARVIASGLKAVGLMKGDIDEAIQAGAHALFFPHGLGHMLGLDVHDMEDLGEDFVGYSPDIKRSKQFGTAYLRLAKQLDEGFIITVEPGIYFIPQLIEKWKIGKQHEAYINYQMLNKYYKFGGIRIEDNVLLTQAGCRVLGDPIPKHPDEIENLQNE